MVRSRLNVKLVVIVLVVITAMTLAGVYAARITNPLDETAAKTPDQTPARTQSPDGKAQEAEREPASDQDVVATIPEPATIVLLGLGAGVMSLKRRNRKS